MQGPIHEPVVISHAVIANAVKQSMHSESMDHRASLAMTAGGIWMSGCSSLTPLRQG
jgi:hypothetical protein